MKFDDYRDDVRCRLAAIDVPPHAATNAELWAGFSEGIPADTFAASFADYMADDADECQGHPAGPYDPMGETVYCDGSCRSL